MQRFGTGLSAALAATVAGHLIHKDRIELAVIANDMVAVDEVSGVAFYDTQHDILALAGETDLAKHYTASASLDDTITGFVVVALNDQAFDADNHLWQWLASAAVLLLVPLLATLAVQVSNRGSRSLPIVSVPDPTPAVPQESFCLTVNIHNQFGMQGATKKQAQADALTMALEVCAIYSGAAATIDQRGIALLFDRETVTSTQTLFAAFLLLKLLDEFETEGEYRCYLSTIHSPSAPGEMSSLQLDTYDGDLIDRHLLLAALCKPGMVLLSDQVHAALDASGKTWAEPFAHPLLDDEPLTETQYCVRTLPPAQADLIASQAEVILGFSQASA